MQLPPLLSIEHLTIPEVFQLGAQTLFIQLPLNGIIQQLHFQVV
jgi:hypothetical protein